MKCETFYIWIVNDIVIIIPVGEIIFKRRLKYDKCYGCNDAV